MACTATPWCTSITRTARAALPPTIRPARFADLPRVTVQLPIFNEQFVIERLLEAVCKLQYPHEKLEIQVLDDSTDETVQVAGAAVERWVALGYPVTYHHRANREGYKAGALARGHEVLHRRVHRHLRRRLRPPGRFPHALHPPVHRARRRHGANALDAHQPQLLLPHRGRSHPARRALRPRARRTLAQRPVLQLQRHRRHVASPRHRRSRRLAARHPHRRHRPLLPRATQGLALRLPAGRGMSRRAAGRDDRLQDAAGALGQGPHPVRHQGPAAGAAQQGRRCASRSKPGITSPPTSVIR